LREPLDKVEAGEEVVNTRRPKAVAHIRPAVPAKKPLPSSPHSAPACLIGARTARPWGAHARRRARLMHYFGTSFLAPLVREQETSAIAGNHGAKTIYSLDQTMIAARKILVCR
jgi:antitoxin (DNA-binding transcriptional repressor) of toxin-antitoxin stability system